MTSLRVAPALRRGIIIFGLLLVSSACKPPEQTTASPGVTTDQILIGSSSALGGHASFLGGQYTLGSKAWFSEVNAAGGIHGRKIEFLTYDDGYEPDRTIANTTKLISDDQVFMLFDYVGTPTSVKIIDIVHEAEDLLIDILNDVEGTPVHAMLAGMKKKISQYDLEGSAVELKPLIEQLGQTGKGNA